MAGVSATFSADFSQFVASTKKAEAALNNVAGSATRVGTHFRGLEGGAAAAGGKVDKFALSVGQADAILGRFGINLPPEIRGLADLGSMATKGGAGLGVLGTAAAVVGTALGSWKLGTVIGEMSGLTQSIADGTAAALGWGDAIAQRAAAGQDVLAKASKTAGFAITDVNVAMAINQAEAERMVAANIKASDAFRKEAADAEAAAIAIAKVHGQNLAKDQQTTLDFLKAQEEYKAKLVAQGLELDADAAREAVLMNGTASEIIKQQNQDVYLAQIDEMRKAGTLTEETDAKAAAARDARNRHDLVNQQTLHTNKLSDLRDELEMETNTLNEMEAHTDQYTRGALEAQRQKIRDLTEAASAQGRAMADAQDTAAAKTEALNAKLAKEVEQLRLLGRLAKDASEFGGSFNVTASNLRESAGGLMNWAKGGNANTKAAAVAAYGDQAEALAREGYSFEEIMLILKGGKKYAPAGPRIPGFGTGEASATGGGGAAGPPAPLTVGRSAAGFGVTPLGRGGAPAVVVQMTISGLIDDQTARKLTDAVERTLMTRLSLGRQLGAA